MESDCLRLIVEWSTGYRVTTWNELVLKVRTSSSASSSNRTDVVLTVSRSRWEGGGGGEGGEGKEGVELVSLCLDVTLSAGVRFLSFSLLGE